MRTTIAPTKNRKSLPQQQKPLRLKTLDDAAEYLAKHLKPVGYNPRGYPVYAKKDIDSLNIILPEDD